MKFKDWYASKGWRIKREDKSNQTCRSPGCPYPGTIGLSVPRTGEIIQLCPTHYTGFTAKKMKNHENFFKRHQLLGRGSYYANLGESGRVNFNRNRLNRVEKVDSAKKMVRTKPKIPNFTMRMLEQQLLTLQRRVKDAVRQGKAKKMVVPTR